MDLKLFLLKHSRMAGRVHYLWGAKAPAGAGIDAADIHLIDCSGYVKKQLEWQGLTGPPDGSVALGEWLRGRYRSVAYADVVRPPVAKDDARLFVAGFDHGGNHRHIWFVIAGKTYESCSKHSGVSSQDARVYRADWCVELV